jgi:hypothetical protein
MSLYAAVAADIDEPSAKWEGLANLLRAAEQEATRMLALAALGDAPSRPGPPHKAINRFASVVDPDFQEVWGKICPRGQELTASIPQEDFSNWMMVVEEAAFRLGMAIGARIGGVR